MVDQITDIVPSDRRKLKDLFHRFSQVISVGDGDLGQTKLLKHTIKTGDAKPIHQPTRRLPYHQRGVVQRMVKDMLQQGIIEHSSGSWSSPMVLAKKQDGSLRFCVDFRRVNDVTKKDVHPIPRMDETLDTLGGAR